MTEKNNSLLTSLGGDIKTKHNSYSSKKMEQKMKIFLNMYHKINPNDESKNKVREFFTI